MTPAHGPLSHRQVLVVFSGLMLGMALAALDQTIVATALPTITRELGGLEHLAWVVTSYLLASTVSTPLWGKLGDLLGRKRLFQAAIVVFLLGSVLSGVAQGMGQLIAFRALQGLGGGGLMVLAQAIIGDVVAPRERGRYMGLFGAVWGAASVVGPLLGGFLTDNLSWRWVFYVNVPVGLLALVVTALVLPSSPRSEGRAKIDYAGASVLASAVTALVLFTTWGGSTYGWSSPVILGLAAGTVLLLVAFVAIERRAAEPIVPPRMFRERTFRVAFSVNLILGAAMFGAISFLPLFLQVVTGASAAVSGLPLLPLMIGVLTASIGAGQITARTGRYRVFPILGTAIAALGMLLLSTMGPDTTSLVAGSYMVLLGLGVGLTMQTLLLATQNVARREDLGTATSAVTFFRSMGSSIGVAIFGALFNAGVPAEGSPGYLQAFSDAITNVFLWVSPLLVVGFAITWLLKEIPLRSAAQAGHAGDQGPDVERGVDVHVLA